MSPADRGMDDLVCGKCSLSIRSGKGPRYYCYSCRQFFHASCWAHQPYPHCPACGGLSARVIPRAQKITPTLIGELEREHAQTRQSHFATDDGSLEPGEVRPDEVADETEYAWIRRYFSVKKKMWFSAGIFATCILALCLFVLVSLSATSAASHIEFVIFLSAVALAGVAIGLTAAKECFARALARTEFRTPVEVTKRYYETALRAHINSDQLLQLLHPATVVRLGKRPEKLLEKRWNDIREECEEMITQRPAYCSVEAVKVQESPAGEAAEKDIEALVAVSCWRVSNKFRPTRLIGRRLLTLRNRAVRTETGWLLRSPYPADPVHAEPSDATPEKGDKPFRGSPVVPG
jgi:hypothetical protein